MSYREVSEIRDGMRIEWDMPIEMDDGLVLRCDIFRPLKKGRYPVILSHGPYGKWLHFEDGYKTAWKRMEEKQPDVMAGSSNKYQSWEVCDPEKWVPDGYVVVRVDSRGCGRSAASRGSAPNARRAPIRRRTTSTCASRRCRTTRRRSARAST